MSGHRITLVFDDGYATTVAATPNETVYHAALRRRDRAHCSPC